MKSFLSLIRVAAVAATLALPFVALAQSANPVTPGYLTTTGCPGGTTPCFVPTLSTGVTWTSATVGVAHGNVLAANVAHSYLLLHNPSAAGGNTIYCSGGGTATVAGAGTLSLAAGQYLSFENNGVTRLAIDCIATGANTPLTIGTN